MHILIADPVSEHHRSRLAADGHDVLYDPELTAEDLPAVVGDHDVLVVRGTRVDRATISEGGDLRLIIRAGSGTDAIDLVAAAERGIPVCNLPGRNATAVAELAVGLLIAIDRRIPEQVDDLRRGRWRKTDYQAATGIAGRSVGVIGLGGIGLAFAQRMAAFDVRLYGIADAARPAPRQQRAEALGMEFVADLAAIARRCDVVSFHVPLSERTRGLIGEPFLGRLARGAIVLNTSRGEVIDPPALLRALDERELFAGIDAPPGEPGTGVGEIDTELARHPRVYGTHHVGGSTAQAQHEVGEGVLEILDGFIRGELQDCVNAQALARAGH